VGRPPGARRPAGPVAGVAARPEPPAFGGATELPSGPRHLALGEDGLLEHLGPPLLRHPTQLPGRLGQPIRQLATFGPGPVDELQLSELITKRVVPYAYPMPRPRSASVDAAIAAAAIDLLREMGYAKLTMGEVARRAGVGKDSLYRRWSSKAALVHEVVFERYPSGYGGAPATGSLLGDVEALAALLQEANTSPEAAEAIPGLLAELGRDPALEARLQKQFYEPMRAGFAAVLDAAHARGETTVPVAPQLVADVLVGTMLFRLSLLRVAADATFPRQLAAFVVGALTPPASPPRTKSPSRGGSP
jgi:AcrR family transcriptional regulator